MIQLQAAKIKESHFLEKILNAVPHIFLILNSNRQVVYASRALLKFLGLDHHRFLLGRRTGEIMHCIHAGETEGGCGTTLFCKVCGAINSIISSQEGKPVTEECRITRKGDQPPLVLRVMTSPVELEGETLTLFSIQDIGHEKRRKVLERVFFHDILNTLGGLVGYAKMFNTAPPQFQEMFRQRILSLSERVIEELTEQKDLTEAEAERLTPAPEPVEGLSILKDLAELYRNHDIAAERAIRIDPESASCPLIIDPKLLKRVLGNMVKNALEASQPGETVTLSCNGEDGRGVFRVHNPGEMPEAAKRQVFQRSFSTKGPGRGIGTYSMKLLTKRYLNGSVGFESSADEGTTFWAELPVEPPT